MDLQLNPFLSCSAFQLRKQTLVSSIRNKLDCWPTSDARPLVSTKTRLCATGSEPQRQHNGDAKQLTDISLSLWHAALTSTKGVKPSSVDTPL